MSWRCASWGESIFSATCASGLAAWYVAEIRRTRASHGFDICLPPPLRERGGAPSLRSLREGIDHFRDWRIGAGVVIRRDEAEPEQHVVSLEGRREMSSGPFLSPRVAPSTCQRLTLSPPASFVASGFFFQLTFFFSETLAIFSSASKAASRFASAFFSSDRPRRSRRWQRRRRARPIVRASRPPFARKSSLPAARPRARSWQSSPSSRPRLRTSHRALRTWAAEAAPASLLLPGEAGAEAEARGEAASSRQQRQRRGRLGRSNS